MRVSKQGAIILLTTHGDIFKTIMTEIEIEKFEDGNIVTRANVVEGHRVYTAFQPNAFMHKLVEGKCEILKYTEGTQESWGKSQDLWTLKKL